MGKGGARARSGPAPDPNALRREKASDGEWWSLPAAGRQGEAPVWPLSEPTTLVDGRDVVLTAVQERELELWAREWVRPQAVMWERNGQECEVALYVRSLVAAERADATTAARTLVRQQQEALGISLPGLARNRWRIADVAVVESSGSGSSRTRSRLKVVPGGAG